MKFSRRKLMQWAQGSAVLGGLLRRPASAQAIAFIDLAITPDGLGLWALDHMGRVRSFGGGTLFGGPPDPVKPSPFVALVPTPTGGGRHAGVRRSVRSEPARAVYGAGFQASVIFAGHCPTVKQFSNLPGCLLDSF